MYINVVYIRHLHFVYITTRINFRESIRQGLVAISVVNFLEVGLPVFASSFHSLLFAFSWEHAANMASHVCHYDFVILGMYT